MKPCTEQELEINKAIVQNLTVPDDQKIWLSGFTQPGHSSRLLLNVIKQINK